MEVTVAVLNETTSSSQAYSSYITFWDIQLPGLESNIGDVSHQMANWNISIPMGCCEGSYPSIVWQPVAVIGHQATPEIFKAETSMPAPAAVSAAPASRRSYARRSVVSLGWIFFVFCVPNWVAERHVFFSFGSIMQSQSAIFIHDPWSLLTPWTASSIKVAQVPINSMAIRE